MREAKRWFLEEVVESSDKNFVNAVKLFVSMDDIVNKCTRESFRILEGNDFLTYYAARMFKVGQDTRVVELVHHYATDHARECLPLYPNF